MVQSASAVQVPPSERSSAKASGAGQSAPWAPEGRSSGRGGATVAGDGGVAVQALTSAKASVAHVGNRMLETIRCHPDVLRALDDELLDVYGQKARVVRRDSRRNAAFDPAIRGRLRTQCKERKTHVATT